MIETGNILTEAISQALETMAFLTIAPMEEDLAAPENPLLAEVSFTGPKKGTIQILAGADFCKILAENMGAIEQADDRSCRDALKELANVTCGLLLPMLANAEAVFDVTVPTLTGGDPDAPEPSWQEMTADANCSVANVEGYLVAAKLVIEA